VDQGNRYLSKQTARFIHIKRESRGATANNKLSFYRTVFTAYIF